MRERMCSYGVLLRVVGDDQGCHTRMARNCKVLSDRPVIDIAQCPSTMSQRLGKVGGKAEMQSAGPTELLETRLTWPSVQFHVARKPFSASPTTYVRESIVVQAGVTSMHAGLSSSCPQADPGPRCP